MSKPKKFEFVGNVEKDPEPFKLVYLSQLGEYLMCIVQYKNRSEFTGMKGLLYYGLSIEDVHQSNSINSEINESETSPVLTFKPNKQGVELAFLAIAARLGLTDDIGYMEAIKKTIDEISEAIKDGIK